MLREAGLVKVRREAQRRVYSLRLEPLAEVDDWLGRYRALWEQRLDALHTEVARGKHRTKEHHMTSNAAGEGNRIVGTLRTADGIMRAFLPPQPSRSRTHPRMQAQAHTRTPTLTPSLPPSPPSSVISKSRFSSWSSPASSP